jgi:hypothetical protein
MVLLERDPRPREKCLGGRRLSTDEDDALATARGECLLGDGPQISQMTQMYSLPRVEGLVSDGTTT